jgi:hypothetical protein
METGYKQLYWEEIREGDLLPRVDIEITFRRVIMTPAATWDYMPGHHEPDYAQRQGQKTIFLNAFFLQGFIDRVVTSWAGPQTFIAKRKMTMITSIYAGDTAYGVGKVARVFQDDQGRAKAEVQVGMYNQDDTLCVSATVTIMLPSGSHQ